MVTESVAAAAPDTRRHFGWLHVLGFVLAAIVITIVATVWIVRSYIFHSEFTPVTLSAKEEQVLDAKLERLESIGSSPTAAQSATEGGALQPEKYSEEGASRDIAFSEKELNALVAKNTDLAQKLAIDLSDDLVSAKLLVPMDEDFPLLGGKTLRVKAGMELAYDQGKPIVVLKGVSVMGVPIPNAWLGGLKNIDLVREFGGEEGFWKAFAAGVEHIGVQEERLQIKLKE
ncbi:MAG: arginine N-succinyltransferase [Gammaproteobacteria bacterium]